MILTAIQKLVEGIDLTEQEMMGAMNCIMEGNATQAQIGSFMTALRIKGETIDEITCCARVMREKADSIYPNVDYFIDTVGTGGDKSNTFNISTASAFVASAGGVVVAKHGNRSVSSICGSADVLEALGISISITPQQVKECIEDVGIGFMFAPTFHKSMKHAAGPRKELGIRSIFNILGPLTNPANAKGQLLGIYDEKLTEPMAIVLRNLGLERALVIHGDDGLDEITTTNTTSISELKDGDVISYKIKPEDFNINKANKSDLVGGDAKENAKIILKVFAGEKGPKRDVVVLNSAAAMYVGKVTNSLAKGVKMAEEIIDSGRAMKKLEELKSFCIKF